MIICVDFDNILNNLTEKAVELYNMRNGANIQLSDITSYNFVDCLHKEDADGICALFKDKELWDSLKPIPGSREALKKLIKNGHKVYIATATDPINFSWKCQWLEQYFPFISSNDVIRIMDKGLLKTDVLIDDHISNLIDNFCDRICLNYPWNQSASKDFAYCIRRAYNWDDIMSFIYEMERKDVEWQKQ